MAGLQGSVEQSEGTATAAFQGFPLDPIPDRGKDRNRAGQGQGRHVVVRGDLRREGHQYVAVAVVEQAGFGAQTAAPIVRNVIESMIGLNPGPVQVIDQGHD